MKVVVCYIILLFSGFKAIAAVDPKNGLFYISYVDMEFPGEKADISRSYNSTSTRTGLFGYGWSSFIESKVAALPDGALSLQWWGNATDYYEPAVIDKKGLYIMIDRIIADLIKTKKLNNDPVSIAEKRAFYAIDHKERAAQYIKLQQQQIAPIHIPDGTNRKWLLDMNQFITWNGKTFTAQNWEDRYEFNAAGKLIHDHNKQYSMRFYYEKNNLSRITIDDSVECRIKTDAQGKIISILSVISGKQLEAIYKYDAAGNLLYSLDAGNNQYWFNYDYSHNLVRIQYIDSTTLDITYDAASNRVIKLKETNGAFSTYQYPYFYTEEGRINYNHYATRIQRYDSIGKLIFTDYKEYESRIKEDGSSYLYHVLEKSDTGFHEILYNPEVGNASYRKKNNKEAWAGYDDKNRPSWLYINDSIYRTTYNLQNLPEYFSKYDSSSQTGISYLYHYDEEGNLKEVIRNDETFRIYYGPDNIIEIIGDKHSIILEPLSGDSIRLHGNRGTIDLSKEEWKELSDSAIRKLVSFKVNMDKAALLKDAGERESKKIEERKQAMLRRKRSESEKSNNTRKKLEQIEQTEKKVIESREDKLFKISQLYYYLSDIINTQKIEHEWIWQRM